MTLTTHAPDKALAAPTIVLDDSAASKIVSAADSYVGNSNSMKFHYLSCTWAKKVGPANRVEFDSREAAVSAGYVPCKVCKP